MTSQNNDATSPAAEASGVGETASSQPAGTPAGAEAGQKISTFAEQHGEAPVLLNLPLFEGPLDLLLHLIREHEVDILDIPIALITTEYLKYLDLMRALNIDVAAEYLLMAATLAHIKSKMLLPREPDDQDDGDDLEYEGDPREELVRQLLEYKKYKDAAETLSGGAVLGRDVFTRGAAGAEDRPAARLEVSVFDMIQALSRVLERARVYAPYEINVDGVSVTQRVREILDVLVVRGSIDFVELLTDGLVTRERVIVTFLAVLEMARRGIVSIRQPEWGGPILLKSEVASVAEGTERAALAEIESEWSEDAPSSGDEA